MIAIRCGDEISPAFTGHDSVVCVFEVSEQYVSFFDVFLKSFLSHISHEHNYDILIFSSDISLESEKIIGEQVKDLPNLSIRFYNPIAIVQEYIRINQHTYLDLNYYRLALPWILKNYDKALNLGVDMVVVRDIYPLYATHMNDDIYIAGVRDLDYVGRLNMDIPPSELCLSVPENYVNADVLLYNLKQIRENVQLHKLMDVWNRYLLRLAEQDVINMYFENHILFLDGRWNVFPKGMISDARIQAAAQQYQDAWEACLKDPYIIHFAGTPKPWDNPTIGYASTWWNYAKDSCFYPRFIYQMVESKLAQRKPLLNRVIDSILPKDPTLRKRIKDTTVWKGLRKIFHKITGDPDMQKFGKRK